LHARHTIGGNRNGEAVTYMYRIIRLLVGLERNVEGDPVVVNIFHLDSHKAFLRMFAKQLNEVMVRSGCDVNHDILLLPFALARNEPKPELKSFVQQ